MTGKLKIGIVAAMEREIGPLVREWNSEKFVTRERSYKAYTSAEAVLMCAGIGSAWDVTKVLIERYDPEMILSVGFAGSLESAIRVPEVFVPAEVLEESSGTVSATGVGRGRLVTTARVADQSEKRRLALDFGASAVDMEASQVAEVSRILGKRFLAVKVVSDDLGDDISFIGDFVTPPVFRTGAFISYIALRPFLWKRVWNLLRNSNRAQKVLCGFLERTIKNTNRLELSLALADEYSASATTK